MFMDLAGRPVLVVGGGAVALRKVRSLLICGADIRLVAPQIHPEIEALAAARADRTLQLRRRPFQEADLENVWLVFAATDNREQNHRLFRLCNEKHLPVNCVDDPAHCSFLVPAVMTRGDLSIAVGTGGQSPSLARRLCRDLETQLPAQADRILADLAGLRDEIKQNPQLDFPQRERIWREILSEPLLGNPDGWDHLAEKVRKWKSA